MNIVKGDKIRLDSWSHCYLFVRRVNNRARRIEGIAYEPRPGRKPIERETGAWDLALPWIRYTADTRTPVKSS